MKKRFSPWSWGNSPMSRINTSSPVSHEGEEVNFFQKTTHHQRLPCESKTQRRLPCGPPAHSLAKLFSPVDHTPRTSLWVRNTKNLCTYPPRLEYASTDPIEVRTEEYSICAHILWELNMQAQTLYKPEFVHISQVNWICRHNGRGRDRDRDQGHPKARALLE